MIPVSKESKVLKDIQSFEKKALSIERISNGIVKDDPFKDYATADVWFMAKGKLIRNNKNINGENKNGK